MRIAIDANAVGRRSGGDETYTLGLLSALAAIDADNRYDIHTLRPHPTLAGLAARQNFRIVRLRPGAACLRVPFLLPIVVPLRLSIDRVDVYHVQVFAPLRTPCPMVYLLPDVSFRHYPQYYPPALRLRLLLLVPLALRQAARVVTVSEQSKRDIMRFYQVPADRIDVTYNGIDHDRYHQRISRAAVQLVRERYCLPERFILYVGNLHPRKNLGRLLEAYALLRRRGFGHKLVIVGRRRWQASGIDRLIEQLGIRDGVHSTGYVPDDDVPGLYQAADVVAYPSIVEGFGLPPVEAMACGTPVVTSNCSVFPEIVGDAAQLVDPLRKESIAEGIARVLEDSSFRAVLIERGLDRAKRFRWEITARETLASYAKAAEGGQRSAILGGSQYGA